MALSVEKGGEKGENRLGHYKLLEKIAQGGMAEIFKAETFDPNGLKRHVVIKRILPHISSQQEFIDMLIDEAKIAVQFNHGNIAQIYDLGKTGKDYFIVMEYVEGKTLQQIFKRAQTLKTKIPLPYCLYFIAELANALAYMHGKTDAEGKPLNVVHRDISPQNIIVGPSGTVKVIDFGVAKAADKIVVTESGVLKGKFAYMSPEQAVGDKIDHRSDIFSAGTILWEIVSGERLFRKESNKETLKSVKKADIPSLHDRTSEAPKELDKILRKAMARNPKKRYGHAEDLQTALTRTLYTFYPDFNPNTVGAYLDSLFNLSPDQSPEKPKESNDKDDDKTKHEGPKKKPPEKELKPEEVGEVTDKRRRTEREEPEEKTTPREVAIGEETIRVRREDIDMSPVIDSPASPEEEFLEETKHHEVQHAEKSEVSAIKKEEEEQIEKTPHQPFSPTPVQKKKSSLSLAWKLSLALSFLIFAIGALIFSTRFRPEATPPIDAPVIEPKFATLRLVVSPKEATVALDGKTISQAEVYRIPEIDPRLPHTLLVSSEDYRSFTQSLTFRDGEEKWLDITLPKEPKPTPKAPTYGFLLIESTPPGAAVFIDNKETGKRTPTVIEGLLTGTTHRVGLSKEGLKYHEEPFSVEAGETKSISMKLEINIGTFSFVSDPPGAFVNLNGKIIGESPILNYDIEPGTLVDLKYAKEGFRAWEKSFKVFGGERKRIFQKLAPIERAP